MPQLPDYTALGQTPTPQPSGGVVGYQATTGAETAPGQALAGLGSEFGQIANHIMHQQNRVAAEDAVNKLRSQSLDMMSGDNGFMQKKGSDAVNQPIYDQYSQQIDKAKEAISSSLTPAQQYLFQRRADLPIIQFKHDLLNHITQQRDVYANQVLQSGVGLETRNAVAHYQDANAIGASVERIKGLINGEAERSGWAPDKLADATDKVLSQVHHDVIQQYLANDDLKGASAYYAENKDNLGLYASKVEQELQQQNRRVTAQQFADNVMTDNLSLSDALKKARSQYSGQLQETVANEVKTRFQEQEAAVNLAQKQAAESAWDTYGKTKDIGQVPEPVLDAMGGKARVALEREAEAIASGKSINTDPDTYATLYGMMRTDPDKFQQTDLHPYFDKLSEADRKKFSVWQVSPESMKDAQTQAKQLAEMHQHLGWSASGDKTKIGDFDRAVGDAIEQEQRARGKALGYEDRQKIIDRMAIEGKIAGSGYVFDDTARYYEVAGKSAQKNFVPSISNEDRAQISQRFQAKRGRPPTDAEMQNTFKLWKGLQ